MRLKLIIVVADKGDRHLQTETTLFQASVMCGSGFDHWLTELYYKALKFEDICLI